QRAPDRDRRRLDPRGGRADLHPHGAGCHGACTGCYSRRMTRLIGSARRRWGVAALAAACLGLAGWSVGSGDPGGPAPSTGTEAAPTTAAPPTTAPPAPPATTEPVALPVPEPPPADPYAPTPEVVHGTLALPTLGVSQPLYEGVTLTAIDRGPSHWPGTAMPGEVGNVEIGRASWRARGQT